MLFSQNCNIKPRRGRLRKVWSRLVDDLFASLKLDKASWLKDILDGSSSLKEFQAFTGESISERESLRKDLMLKKNYLYIRLLERVKNLRSICMGWLMLGPDCYQELMG